MYKNILLLLLLTIDNCRCASVNKKHVPLTEKRLSEAIVSLILGYFYFNSIFFFLF